MMVFSVRGCNGLLESWLDNKLLDVADSLLDMGFDCSVVSLHCRLQVTPFNDLKTF